MTRTRKIVLGLTLAVALALILTIWRGVSPLFAEPRITIDYVAEFNAKIAQIPEEDRAWPLYVEVYAAIDVWPDEVDAPGGPAHAPVNASVRAWVQSHAAAAQLARDAAARPHIGAPLSDAVPPEMSRAAAARVGAPPPTDFPEPSQHPMVLSVVLPQLAPVRTFNRLLVAEALVAAEDRNGALAAQNIAAVARLGQQARGYPFIICDMVSFVAMQWASQALARCLDENPDLFSPESLAHMRSALAAFGEGERMSLRLEWEQKQYLDLIQRIYSDDGRGNGHMTRQGLQLMDELGGSMVRTDGRSTGSAPLVPSLRGYADRREAIQMYERLVAAAEEDFNRPPWLRDPPIYAPVRDEVFTQAGRNPLLRLTVSAVSGAVDAADTATLHRDAALVLLALAQHRLDTGAWPTSLDALVPTLLDTIPPDPADGNPLRYTLRGGEPVLYSIGPNRTDDGATAGDIILFPLPPAE